MPDKSAQPETRTWFEEPLRAPGAERSEDSAAERTDGSATEPVAPDGPDAVPPATGNGHTTPLARPAPDPEFEPAPEPGVESTADVPDADVPDATLPDLESQRVPVEPQWEPVERGQGPGTAADAPEPTDPPSVATEAGPSDLSAPTVSWEASESSESPNAWEAPQPWELSERTMPVSAPERHADQPPFDSEATIPGGPTVSADTPRRRETAARHDPLDDDATTTAVIPVVPADPEPAHRPRRSAGQHRFAAPEAPGSSRDDSATTTEIPRIRAASAAAGWPAADLAQPRAPHPQGRSAAGPPQPPPEGRSRHATGSGSGGGSERRLRLTGLVAAAVLGLLALAYGLDVATTRGEVPRGVAVAGVDVGGMQRAAAEQRLREQIQPRLARPIPVRAGDVQTTIVPEQAGLTLDWPGTLDQAGEQPLNPWTRFVSLFSDRDVGVVTQGDRTALTAALEGLRAETDRESVEGTIRFEGASPIPVDPVAGQRLDVPAATEALLAQWARGGVVQLPVTTMPVSTTPEGVRATLQNFVEPAVSGPITVTGEGGQAVLDPEVTASALRFAPDDQGGLTATVDNAVVVDALAPQLKPTERQGKDAGIVIEGGAPVVVPSVEGREIDWEKSLQPLPDVLRSMSTARKMPAIYVTKPAKLTTEQAQGLGVTAQISTFTTGGFADDSGKNIRRAAEQVNGALVLPGETFSLNGHTGPRNAATGYHEAGIIEDGRPARGIGGGVSQFATTLFNASYFAGMTDVEHQEHSYYISRYPAAREATVYEGAIDVKFRNDSPTGVLIQTGWSPDSVTVTFWGTKHVNVESIPGPRTNYTDPETIRVNESPCSPSRGSKGFTASDTRVIRDAGTGEVISRKTRTVRYNPHPRVICG